MAEHTELIARCRRGDRAAQFEVYRLYSQAMYAVCCNILDNPLEAEEVMQEAFFKAFDKIASFRGEVAFGAWLKRITINACLDTLKRQRIKWLSLDDQMLHANQIPDTEVDEQVIDSVEAVKLALAKLPNGYRLVLTLHLIEGYEYAEIAEMIGTTQSNVRSQFFRAKQHLQELLAAMDKR